MTRNGPSNDSHSSTNHRSLELEIRIIARDAFARARLVIQSREEKKKEDTT